MQRPPNHKKNKLIIQLEKNDLIDDEANYHLLHHVLLFDYKCVCVCVCKRG